MYDTFTVKNGKIEDFEILHNQYFLIKGSVLNDGLYCYPDEQLHDETFEGNISLLAIPKDFIELSNEINEFVTKHGDNSPYVSESFGGYSYSKPTNEYGVSVSWKDVFKSQLLRYKKI